MCEIYEFFVLITNAKYSCEYCEYKSSQKGDLKIHKKSIHDGVKYSYEYCDCKATEKGNLQRHV